MPGLSQRFPRTPGSPAYNVKAVTPSDTQDLPEGSLLYVGVSGHVSVETIDGTTAVLENHPVGYMPIIVKRVRATGTTATKIVALY